MRLQMAMNFGGKCLKKKKEEEIWSIKGWEAVPESTYKLVNTSFEHS